MPGYLKTPDADYLHSQLTYCPQTGILRWKSNREIAGCRQTVGQKTYIRIVIDQRKYVAHRIIWKMVHGEEPLPQIDHRDGDGTNNRLANLRVATAQQNAANRKGVEGVVHEPVDAYGYIRRKPWKAQAGFGGIKRNLGRFATRDEARKAYLAAKQEAYGEFA